MTTSALMTTAIVPSPGPFAAGCLDAIGFARLHALVARGYRPLLGAPAHADGHVCISLTHPRAARKDPPPPVTLWSDGIVSTSKVLFPQKYVPEQDKAPPDWQRYILPQEGDRFETFLAGIARPDVIDLYLKPAWAEAKVFLAKLAAGSAVCILVALAGKTILG